LQEIYPGQPGRKTVPPGSELPLRAMKDIGVSVVEVNGEAHAPLSPLTAVQQRLLELWGPPLDSYERLADSEKLSANTSEL
jgi:hypothetical protein